MRTFHFALCVLIASGIMPTVGTYAQTVDENLWVTNGDVYALAKSGNTIYIAGAFTQVGPVGGPFVTRRLIAALDATTGEATSWNPNPTGSWIQALAISETKLYVGGIFSSIGGQLRNNVAAFDLATGYVTPWNPNANSKVGKLAVSGSAVFAGGTFTVIGGQSRNCIAAIDEATGIATPWNPSANGEVTALTVSGSIVYAGGYFNTIGGQPRNCIAAIDANTGFATAWNPNASYRVLAITVSGGTVYAGGNFSSIGGQWRQNIAALDAGTGLATSWNPSASSTVRAITVSGSTVYAGGDFTYIGSATQWCVAALDANSNNATDWNPGANNIVFDLGISGSTVYVGGRFTSIGGANHTGIAAVNDPSLCTRPIIGVVEANLVDPIQVNTQVNMTASFTDPDLEQTNSATWYWGDNTNSSGDISGSPPEWLVSGSHAYAAAGVYSVTLTVGDECGGCDTEVYNYVVVYDPSAGFVTGGGWISSPEGAYISDPELTGKATFGFISKYQRGAGVPTGKTEFQFHAADMKFKSTEYEWLVIASARAQYKGSGTINGSGDYKFMLTAIDGQINGGGGDDKFRIRIWDRSAATEDEGLVYDNQMGGDINADPTTVLGGGSIVIHRSGVAKRGSGSLAPETFALYQNYPNPFNPTTTIEYDIPQPTHVRLVVYDITGRQVVELVNGMQEEGYYEARLDASNLASGLYIYRLNADKFTTTRKLMVLK